MRTDTQTLASALDVLAREIQSGDGVANAAIAEAAERLRELDAEEERLQHAVGRAMAMLVIGGRRDFADELAAYLRDKEESGG